MHAQDTTTTTCERLLAAQVSMLSIHTVSLACRLKRLWLAADHAYDATVGQGRLRSLIRALGPLGDFGSR
jgi:hypothetical protein